jgi:hypothetical protein
MGVPPMLGKFQSQKKIKLAWRIGAVRVFLFGQFALRAVAGRPCHSLVWI